MPTKRAKRHEFHELTRMKPIRTAEAGVTKAVEAMLPEIRSLIEEARHRAVTGANLAMVTLYWKVGGLLTRDIQQGAKRGGYGERLLEGLGGTVDPRVWARVFDQQSLGYAAVLRGF